MRRLASSRPLWGTTTRTLSSSTSSTSSSLRVLRAPTHHHGARVTAAASSLMLATASLLLYTQDKEETPAAAAAASAAAAGTYHRVEWRVQWVVGVGRLVRMWVAVSSGGREPPPPAFPLSLNFFTFVPTGGGATKADHAQYAPVYDIPISGKMFPAEVPVFIEVAKGSRMKYEWDSDLGLLRLDRVLHSAVFYPFDYGFIPQTLCGDGDPLDVLVMGDSSLEPGTFKFLVLC